MAEAQGFEPWGRFHARRFSRPVHSTTLPNLRLGPVTEGFLIRKATFCDGEIRRQICLESFKTQLGALSSKKIGGIWPVWWKNISRNFSEGSDKLS